MTLFLLCSDDFDDISATDEHVTEVSSVSTVQRHACPVDGQVTTVRHSQTAARASTQQVLGPAGLTKAPNPADEIWRLQMPAAPSRRSESTSDENSLLLLDEPESSSDARRRAGRIRGVQQALLGALVIDPIPPEVVANLGELSRVLDVDDKMIDVAGQLADQQFELAAIDFDRNGYTADWQRAGELRLIRIRGDPRPHSSCISASPECSGMCVRNPVSWGSMLAGSSGARYGRFSSHVRPVRERCQPADADTHSDYSLADRGPNFHTSPAVRRCRHRSSRNYRAGEATSSADRTCGPGWPDGSGVWPRRVRRERRTRRSW